MSNIPGRIPVKTRALFRLRRDEKGVGGRVRASICCLTPDTEAALKFIREKIEGGGGKKNLCGPAQFAGHRFSLGGMLTFCKTSVRRINRNHS